MKRTILSLIVLTAISLTTMAVTTTTQQRRESKNYSTELDLSTEQRAKLKEINKEYDKKFEDVRNKKMTSDERREKFRSLREEKRNAVDKILTAEQKNNFNSRNYRHHRGYNNSDCWSGEQTTDNCWSNGSRNGCGYENGRRGEYCNNNEHRRGCGMFNNITLTEDQQEQIDNLYDKYATGADGSYEKYRTEMMKVLTSEQQKQYEENNATCTYGPKDKSYRRGHRRGNCH